MQETRIWMHMPDSALFRLCSSKISGLWICDNNCASFYLFYVLTSKVFLFSYQSMTVKECKQELWKQTYQILLVHLL